MLSQIYQQLVSHPFTFLLTPSTTNLHILSRNISPLVGIYPSLELRESRVMCLYLCDQLLVNLRKHVSFSNYNSSDSQLVLDTVELPNHWEEKEASGPHGVHLPSLKLCLHITYIWWKNTIYLQQRIREGRWTPWGPEASFSSQWFGNSTVSRTN